MTAGGYEVYGEVDGRWFLESAHAEMGEAIGAMEALAGTHGHGYARVAVFEERRFQPRKVREQTCGGGGAPQVRVESLDDAPMCTQLAAYYGLPARLTLGRLLRRHLEADGVTALELLHDAVRLRRLLTDHQAASRALGHVAGLQARHQGVGYQARLDALHTAADHILAWAKRTRTRTGARDALRKGGLPAVRERLPRRTSETGAVIWQSAAVAHELHRHAEWDTKVAALTELADVDPGDTLVAVDGALAEIFDGAEAMRSVVDWHPTLDGLERGLRPLITLARGDAASDRLPTSAAERVRALAATHGLPRTRHVVLERVDKGLRGVQPLRKEGGGDGDALDSLVRALATPGGVVGGAEMAEALVHRARVACSDGGEDLEPTAAVGAVVARFPGPASRTGFLLALAGSTFGTQHMAAIKRQLAQVIAGLDSAGALLPANDGERAAVLRDLRAHLRDFERAHAADDVTVEAVRRVSAA